MKKLALLGSSFLLLFVFLLSPVNVLAAVENGACAVTATEPLPKGNCEKDLVCQLTPPSTTTGVCVKSGIVIVPPAGKGFPTLGSFITNTLTISFAVAILVVLVMLIWGAFEWITSGGDKETVGKARGRIVNALIGLAVLAIAYALARVAAQFLGFDIGNIEIPKPPATGPGY